MSATAEEPPEVRCHNCGSPLVLENCPPSGAVCGWCLPISYHVVSNTTGPEGEAVATCECGWRVSVSEKPRMKLCEMHVRMHWADVIKRQGGDGSALEANS